jgi:hypothetical protein
MGAMGYLIHSRLLERLRASSSNVYDLRNIKMHSRPRIAVAETAFSQTGRTCLMRARLEAERRVCGSTAMVVHSPYHDSMVAGTSMWYSMVLRVP